ncbi:MAG TPA: hypothetical protein PKK95_10715 [Vicinamibacterales bacterium]|nr:hypothetical protein [Acidobacteriota bacterium]HOC18733.1 hypothetical protein [Vicinamibacterales bacterium]
MIAARSETNDRSVTLPTAREARMWLVTTFGFYSVVEKAWDRERGSLTVRARARKDLETLRQRYLPELGAIAEDESADYRFRAQAPREQVVEAFSRAVRDIDYDNFKEAVLQRQGYARERIYHDAWHAFLAIQHPARRVGRGV